MSATLDEIAGTFATESPLLVAKGVTKSFWGRTGLFKPRAENRALDDVSVTLREGEILGLVGESGCGKSTFAKVMIGLEKADSGTLDLGERRIFAPGERALPPAERGIQMVFQDPYGSLNPRMNVHSILAEGLRIRGELKAAEISAEVRRHLELVGLGPDSLTKYPHQFSGGQRQRLCIARAIITRPRLLIADEAASALDVSVQMQILNLLLDLRDRMGLAIIFISHDMAVIEYLCDRIAVMYRGRIVETGGAAAVVDHPRHPYTERLIAARPRVGRRRTQRQEQDAESMEAPLAPGASRCVYVERCPRASEICHTEAPPMEQRAGAAFACFHPLEDRGDPRPLA
jgi:oligopeptide/dipeptide ABC transporter ATP-binding protein